MTRVQATPNHALQRTAPRVTVAAFHVRSRLVRAWCCLTSVASFFAPPSQLPRHAPLSLSLGSLGAFPMRAFQASLFLAVSALLCSCSGDRRIDLDSALRSTSQGDFNLIVFTDQFISFQRDGFHKYQYYFSPPLPQTVVDQIKSAADQARSKKHEVHIEDIRASKGNTPSA